MIISIVVLFILQILAFFFIVLLQVKIARFNQLEEKQNRLMRDMDTTISAYLLQMREENDRFIAQLTATKPSGPVVVKAESSVDFVEATEVPLPKVEVKKPRVVMPKKTVAKAYQQQETHTTPKVEEAVVQKEQESSSAPMLVQQAISLQEQGLTIEEIAKRLQKGKTEIELLLKFRA